MARPTSKKDLLFQSEENYTKLKKLINSYSLEEQHQEFPPQFMNRDIRDVLGHLYEWHQLAMNWYKVGMSGKQPAMPAEGYNWKTSPDLNKVIQGKYQSTSLHDVEKMLENSHKKVTEIMEKHSNEELFERAKYPWTGNNALGAYFISSTSSHYDWATKLIKKSKKVK